MIIRILVFCCLIGGGLAQGNTYYIPQFGHGADTFGNTFNTTISFINLGATTARANVRSFDAEGNEVNLLLRPGSIFEEASAVSEIGAEMANFGFAQIESSADNLMPGGIQAGWVEVTSTEDIAVEVLFEIRDTASGTVTTSTSVLPRPTTTGASIVAEAVGSASTGVALLNPPTNAEDANIEVLLLDNLGRQVGSAMLILPPGNRVARFLSEIVMGLDNFRGSFEVRSDLPISILPLRQDGIELTTQEVHRARDLQ